ncbi:MAG: CYTH domain-containing protein [Sphaerochaetaceae bacterium]
MSLEVELKAHVPEIGNLRRRLSSRCQGETSEEKKDVYYCKDGGPALFRIRYEAYDGQEGTVLFTCKEKRINNGIEVNTEHEFTSRGNEFAACQDFALALGYQVYVRKTKSGYSYSLSFPDFPPLHIELVEVPPLGCFIEMEFVLTDQSLVEQAKARLLEVLASLGIDAGDIESRYYMELLKQTE